MFYIHPWELDPGHPRVPLERKARITHYTRLGVTQNHLERLTDDFQFDSVRGVIRNWTEYHEVPEFPIEMLQD